MAAESPLMIIIDMIRIVLTNTINTLVSIFVQLFRFFGSMRTSLSGSGMGGLVLAVTVTIILMIFIGKFVFNAGKSIIIMFIAGLILFYILIISLV